MVLFGCRCLFSEDRERERESSKRSRIYILRLSLENMEFVYDTKG